MMEERKENFFSQLLLVGVGVRNTVTRKVLVIMIVMMFVCIILFLHGFFFEFFV
jgi:hypothetical protein